MAANVEDFTTTETLAFIVVERRDAFERVLKIWREPVRVPTRSTRQQVLERVEEITRRVRDVCGSPHLVIEFREGLHATTATDETIADCLYDLGRGIEATAFMMGFCPVAAE